MMTTSSNTTRPNLLQRLQTIRLGRWCVILMPMLWLAAFFFIPFLVVFKISLSEAMIAVPPY